MLAQRLPSECKMMCMKLANLEVILFLSKSFQAVVPV